MSKRISNVLKGDGYVPIMWSRQGDWMPRGLLPEGWCRIGRAALLQEMDMTRRVALSVQAARELRGDLKGALTGFANGRGSVEALLHQIERIAKYVSANPDIALGQAKNAMTQLVCRYAPVRLEDSGLPGVRWDDLYRGVVNGRNDIAHTGTEAALAGTRTAALATVLLAALAEAAKGKGMSTMKDVMVSNPICAHGWQTLSDLRRTMLVNDYSALPLSEWRGDKTTWACVRAEELAAYLAQERGARGRTLAEAQSGHCCSEMDFYPAATVRETTSVDNVLGQGALGLPVVVTKCVGERHEIIGIVTAFDLL